MVSAPRSRVVTRESRRAVAPAEPSMWRQVGWTFRAGEIQAIERRGGHTCMPTSPA